MLTLQLSGTKEGKEEDKTELLIMPCSHNDSLGGDS